MLVEKLNLQFDHAQILKELYELEQYYQWGKINDKSYSFAVTSRDGSTTDGTNAFVGDESIFKLLTIYNGTYIEEIISDLNYGRIRFLKMLPGHIMKIHKDPGIRYHIPLQTNQYCGFMDDNLNTYTMSTLGGFYKLDGCQMHCAFNCSRNEERIHLVIVEKYEYSNQPAGV